MLDLMGVSAFVVVAKVSNFIVTHLSVHKTTFKKEIFIYGKKRIVAIFIVKKRFKTPYFVANIIVTTQLIPEHWQLTIKFDTKQSLIFKAAKQPLLPP